MRYSKQIVPFSPKSEPPLELLSVREAARRLAISRSSCYELLREGRLTGYRPAGTLRIDAGSIARYLESVKVR